ncbi:MAG: 16S rRNA (uracil(1498)-N(3))-methyltransferase [Methylotenera sp.]|nr:16S rRNA (uracil(1498)-N(3))-methyltransferase [Methylotenera sp.]
MSNSRFSNPRFYSAENLAADLRVKGVPLKLADNAAIHATRVLRLNVGDEITLFNGDGFDYACELLSVKKNEVLAQVNASKAIENESPLHITLLQGISSGDRMDYTIQKAVELGVKCIQPISTERSVVKLSVERAQKRVEHWQNVVISACEQCGRSKIPKVLTPISLLPWLASNPEDGATRILLNPIAAKRLAELPSPTQNIQASIQLLIGAEGGLTNTEIKAALDHGFQSILLGPRILRTETAALTAISAMQALWGDY